MTVIMMQIRMEGDARGCAEVAARELEEILGRIGWAEVRCVSAVELPETAMEGWKK